MSGDSSLTTATQPVDCSMGEQPPIFPCRPVQKLATRAAGKPMLFIGHYKPDQQGHPTDAHFSNIRLYPYGHRRSDFVIFTPDVYVKEARAFAEKLITNAPAQKKYQMLLVAYPETAEYQGTMCGILRLALDITAEPMVFRPGEKLVAPEEIQRQCFRPNLNHYRKSSQAQHIPDFRKLAPQTQDEKRIEYWNRELKENPSTFEDDFIRTPIIKIAEKATGRPIILYATFTGEHLPGMTHSCFRDIKPFCPGIREKDLTVITDHLMVDDAGENIYRFEHIQRRTLQSSRRVLLIGYPRLYINNGFSRCGFSLAKGIGITAILYKHPGKDFPYNLPDEIIRKCYVPDPEPYLKA